MVGAIEVDTDTPLRPAHIDAGDESADFVEYRNLRLRHGESGFDQEASESSDSYGDSAPPSTSGSVWLSCSQTTDTGTALSDRLNVADLQIRRVHQGIDALHADLQLRTPSDVEGCARRRRHQHVFHRLRLAWRESVGVNDQHRRCAPVGVH